MPRVVIVIIPLLLLAFAAACDDGGPATPPITTTPTPTPTPIAEPTATSTPTPQATPEPTPTAVPSPTPTPRPATQLDSAAQFLERFADEQIIEQRCTFDAAAGQVDCAQNGLYQPDPPPGEATSKCDVLLVDGEPIAITCETQEPLTVIYYKIPQ